MPKLQTAPHSEMEGGGAYNRHAQLQADGAAFAVQLLQEASRNIEIGPADHPLVIADYGSSQGKNSLAPMRAAIRVLRERAGSDRPILVYHTDLPANDFNSLFEVLNADPDRYANDDRNVFPCAIGRSFYGEVLPPNQVHLGWCSYAAVWLSRVPMPIPGHFCSVRSTGAVRAEWDRQGAEDWAVFLTLRARELRPGGRLVVVLPGFDDDRWAGFEDLFDCGNTVLEEMTDEGVISAEERARISMSVYFRQKRDLLAPFERDGQFQGLKVEQYQLSTLQDPAWMKYQEDRNKELLAARQALFFRSTFLPALAAGLSQDRAPDAHRAFGDRLEQGLKRKLEQKPAPVNSRVQTIVFARIAC